MAHGSVACAYLLALVWSTPSHAAEQRGYSAQKTSSAITLACPDGRPILRYVIGALPAAEQPQTTVPAVGYMHPVYTPAGEVLTESGHTGGDHTWLRGVFLAWPQVTGEAPAGFWTCGQSVWKEKGQIVNRAASAAADDTRASLSVTNAWSDGKTDLLLEKTELHACLASGVYVIDLKCELSSASQRDVTLRPWAFAGLAFHSRRVPNESVSFHSPLGEVKLPPPLWNNPSRNWPSAAWYDLLLSGKDGRSCGLAMVAHRQNGVSSWQAYYRLRMLNPNATAVDPFTIKPGKPLILRYRLITHDGRPPAETLNQLATMFGQD